MSYQAIIFDMDGLLMDSERIGLEVMPKCAQALGYDITVEQVRHTIGSNKQSSSDFYHQFYPDLDTEKLFLTFKNAMCDLARQGMIPLKKGAAELLKAGKAKGIPMGVASSSGRETIGVYLDAAGISGYFDVLMTGSGLPSKPAPDVFLKTAEALAAAPERCLVLEDSMHGVQAGRNAGMTVCMVPDMIPYTEELRPYCDHVLPDLSAVIPLLDA